MILKILGTGSLTNTLRYVSRDGAQLITGDLIGGTPEERSEIMRVTCLAGRPALKHEGIHLILSAAPGQHLTRAQWEHAAREALKGLGLEGGLSESWLHLDTKADHLHLVATGRATTGKGMDRRNERIKAKRICRQLEREFGFPSVNNDRKTARRKRPVGPADPGVIAEMRRKVGRFVGARGGDLCHSFAQFSMALNRQGVEVVPKIREGRLIALGYRMNGHYVRAGDLHQDFTFTGLKRSGLDWDIDRDLPVIKGGKPYETVHEFIPAPPWAKPGRAVGGQQGHHGDRNDAARARRVSDDEGRAGAHRRSPAAKVPRRSPRAGGHGGKNPGRAR